MKICPTCRRTYEDDGLNFCLEDGSILTFISADAAPTVVMERRIPSEPTPAPGFEIGPTPPHAIQAKKRSSKAWMLVMAIVAILILVCGGGFVGLFMYVASVANSNGAGNKRANTQTTTRTNTVAGVTPSVTPVDTGTVKEVDLSGWVEEPTTWLETEFEDGEFFMTSKQKGYYYVLVAKNDDYSNGGVARVTVRNTEGEDVKMGFGLVFHSDVTPLANDYAILIDTTRKKYRVVRHENEQERTITAWTNSNLIKEGAQPNLLEARDNAGKIELYINGELATTITNKEGPRGGVPGLYVGDGAKIGFKELEIVK